VIIISHNLVDVFAVADYISVLFTRQMVRDSRPQNRDQRRCRRLHHGTKTYEGNERMSPKQQMADPNTGMLPASSDLIGSCQEGGLMDQVRAWSRGCEAATWASFRGGRVRRTQRACRQC